MADVMDSDTSTGFKRRITEFQEILSQSSASPSPSPITAEDKQSSEIVSTPKQDQEDSPSFISESSPNSINSEKAKCSSLGKPTGTNIEENQESNGSVNGNYPSCGSVPLSSGSEGIEGATVANGEERFVADVVFVKDVKGNILNDEKESLFSGSVDKDVKDNGKYEVGVSGILKSEKFCEVVGGNMGVKVGSSVVQSETELENKKKQLLEELEAMLVPEDKCHDEEVHGLESYTKIVEFNGRTSDFQEEQRLIRDNAENVDPIKGIDGSVGYPLGIKVVDETALIEQVVTFPKIVGNDSGHKAEFVVPTIRTKKDGNMKLKENDENKGKRSRRRSKGGKKALPFDGKPENIAEMAEGNSLCLKNRERNELGYSRQALMSLRFVNIVEQRKKWKDIYVGLGPVVGKEYDDLATSHSQKSSHLHFDPRQRFGKKEEFPAVFGEACSGNLDTELGSMVENPSLLDVTCSHRTGDEDDYDVEGEHIEDNDSEDDYSSIQRPAFMVEGEPNFDSGPPEDGFEYLRRVRWEASQIPKVRVAKFDRSKSTQDQSVYMPQIPEIAKCAEHLLPSKHWEDTFLAEFSELRMALSRLDDSTVNDSGNLQLETTFGVKSYSDQLPKGIILESPGEIQTKEAQFNQLDGYFSLEHSSDPPCLASPEENSISSQLNNSVPKYSKSGNSGDSPFLSVILGMSSVARVSTLRKRISSLEDASTFSRNDCLWLFALCAAIDTPVDADTSASFRSLLRKCANLRAAKCELDEEVVMLNILTTISGRYFGQLES